MCSFYNCLLKNIFFNGGNWYCSLHISTERVEYVHRIRCAERMVEGLETVNVRASPELEERPLEQPHQLCM